MILSVCTVCCGLVYSSSIFSSKNTSVFPSLSVVNCNALEPELFVKIRTQKNTLNKVNDDA